MRPLSLRLLYWWEEHSACRAIRRFLADNLDGVGIAAALLTMLLVMERVTARFPP